MNGYRVWVAAVLMSAFASGAFAADLRISGTAPSGATAGQNLVFAFIGLSNSGPGTAQNVQATVTVPEGTIFQFIAQGLGSPVPECTTPPVGTRGNVTCSFGDWSSGTPR